MSADIAHITSDLLTGQVLRETGKYLRRVVDEEVTAEVAAAVLHGALGIPADEADICEYAEAMFEAAEIDADPVEWAARRYDDLNREALVEVAMNRRLDYVTDARAALRRIVGAP